MVEYCVCYNANKAVVVHIIDHREAEQLQGESMRA